MSRRRIIVLLSLLFTLQACTSVKPMPDDAEGLITVNDCNLRGHLQCIYLTGKETFDDGFEGKWTRHWFRMSYIGRACEKRYGRTTAVILESLFAIPHYGLIAIGNGATALMSPLVDSSSLDDATKDAGSGEDKGEPALPIQHEPSSSSNSHSASNFEYTSINPEE